jgi:hypothetical protein
MSRKIIITLVSCMAISAFIASCGKTEKKLAGTSEVFEKKQDYNVKPFRVLVIIGDQWTDPMSYNIDPRRVRGTDFLDVVNMLKIWGVPFDILRLDEQRLQINRFLDGEANPNYGCVIWMADPDKLKGYSANYQTLKRAVEEYGISMIALFDNIKSKQVADLAGLEYYNVKEIMLDGTAGKFTITGEHFITSEAKDLILPDRKQAANISIPTPDGTTPNRSEFGEDYTTVNIVNCKAKDYVRVLGSIGQVPQFVVRDVNKDTKVVWIGVGKDWFRKYPDMRRIFRKALVYSIGYGLFNDNFENGFIFIMDDVGCSEHAWSLKWHYPTPPRDTLLKYLIEPLEQYGFMMVQNITPGFANPEKQIIESPWKVKPFKDIFGNWQDYGSTKEGLDEGLKRGVFEIQSHRAWSHMNWDLDSPPGPWWGGPVDGEMSLENWYNEVVDVRRGYKPVPSNDLLFIYKMGIDAIKKSFGVVPLSAEVRPGSEMREGTHGGDDNGRIAAIAGLGVSRECYVGFDRTIEFNMMMPQQFTCHDIDLTAQTDYPDDLTGRGWDTIQKMTTEQLIAAKIAGARRIDLHNNLNWIDSRKDKHWMGFNEVCAYLHTIIAVAEKNINSIELIYDDHYCKYFEKKPSMWTLELSDSFRDDLGNKASVSIDGKKGNLVLGSIQLLEIPAGIGTHRIEIFSNK